VRCCPTAPFFDSGSVSRSLRRVCETLDGRVILRSQRLRCLATRKPYASSGALTSVRGDGRAGGVAAAASFSVLSPLHIPRLPTMFEWFWNILYNLGTFAEAALMAVPS